MVFKKYLFFFLIVTFCAFCVKGVFFCYNNFGSFNRMIFPGAYWERDVESEYKNNFFKKNQKFCCINTLQEKLEFIKKMNFENYKNEKFINKIPCILLQNEEKNKGKITRHLIVYFGGNGETIYRSCAYNLFTEIRDNTDLNVDFLIVCYPGYACDSSNPTADNFYRYSEAIAKSIFSLQDLGYRQIHFLAFSIGCAMAVDCATKIKRYFLPSLTLINPFTNIKSCAQHMVKNKMPYLKPFCKKALTLLDCDFDNLARIKNVKTRYLNIIFSSNDTVIDHNNSIDLYKNAVNCRNKILYETSGDHCDWVKYDLILILFKNILLKKRDENKLVPQICKIENPLT